MNKILYCLLFCIVSLSASAQNVNYANRALEKYKQGMLAFNSKKYKEAITLFEECEKLSELTHNVGGKSRTSLTGNAYEWKAAAYYRLGDETKAKELDANYRLQPVDMALIIDAEDILMQGVREMKRNDFSSSTKSFQKACAGYEKVLGHDHQHTAFAINQLGLSYFKAHEYAEALKYFEEARDIFQKIDNKNSMLAVLKSNIENCQQVVSKEKEVDKLYDEGVVAYQKRKFSEALGLFIQCDSINKKNKRQMPYYSCNADEWIAACYYQMGDKKHANELNEYFCQFTPIDLRKCPKSNQLLDKFLTTNISGQSKQSLTVLLNTIKEELGENNTLYANTLALLAYRKYNQYAQLWQVWGGDAENIQSDYLEQAQVYTKQAQTVWRKIDKSYANQVRFNGKTLDMSEETKYDATYFKNQLNQAIREKNAKEEKMNQEADLAYKQGIREYKKGDYKSAYNSFEKCLKSNGLAARSPNEIKTRAERTGFYISSNASAWLTHCSFLTFVDKKLLEDTPGMYILQPLDQTTKKGEEAGADAYATSQCDYYDENTKDILIKALKSVKAVQPKCVEYAGLLQKLANYWQIKNDIKEYTKVMSEYLSLVVLDNKQQAQQITNYIRKIANKVDATTFMSAIDPIFEKYEKTSEIHRNSGKVYVQSLKHYYANDIDAKQRISELENMESVAKSDKEVKKYLDAENDAESKGLYSEALIMSENTLRQMKSYYGETSYEYIEELSRIRYLLDRIGEDRRCLEICDNIISLRKKSDNIDNNKLGNDYAWKAAVHHNNGEYEEALQAYSIALNYVSYNENKMEIMSDMASTLYVMGNYDESKRYNDEVIRQYQKNPLALSQFTLRKNFSLRTRLFLAQQKYDEAFKSARYLMKLYSWEETLLEDAIEAYELCALSSFYTGDIFTFITTEKDVIDRKTQYLRSNFSYLTSQQRNAFWEREKFSFNRINQFCMSNMGNPDLLKIGYDAILMSKSILLSADVDFSVIINQSGDEELIKKNQERKKLEDKIQEEKDDSKKKKLKQQLRELEQMLLVSSKRYGDFTRKFSVKWTDVANALKDDEVAVEFFTADISKETCFGAFILRKGWVAPKCILIGKKAEIEELTKGGDLAYTSKELSDKVWGGVIKTGEIKPSDRICFATDDIFMKFGIEYLPTNDGSIMSEKYQMYRLSSTRELCFRDNYSKMNNAYLFGGAIYDAGRETLMAKGMNYSEETRNFLATASDMSKGGVAYLPGTKVEVESIEQLLHKNNFNTVLLTDSSFSEKTMKTLSGKDINLLHISTHGFYWTKIAARNKNYRFLQKGGTAEQVAMTHSGLILSGANHILTGNVIPYGFEDGILTSMEIGKLDFSHVQLAVLSACQTGLGATSADGVFGLQRGFKKAGVKSLIMSLWEVNDEATKVLMTNFYEKLVKGMSKREAFVKAQQYLRTTQNHKFDNPRFWAAFILLDAL